MKKNMSHPEQSSTIGEAPAYLCKGGGGVERGWDPSPCVPTDREAVAAPAALEGRIGASGRPCGSPTLPKNAG